MGRNAWHNPNNLGLSMRCLGKACQEKGAVIKLKYSFVRRLGHQQDSDAPRENGYTAITSVSEKQRPRRIVVKK